MSFTQMHICVLFIYLCKKNWAEDHIFGAVESNPLMFVKPVLGW